MKHSAPPGFTTYKLGTQVWWLKAEWEAALIAAIASGAHTPSPAFPSSGGRGPLRAIVLGNGSRGIVRRYRRGGLVRYILHDLYWDRPPRPFAELRCMEIARQRGVPTVEVLGAGVQWHRLGLYRGVLITREVVESCHFWAWLQMRKTGTERERALIAVAYAVARLHHAGIAHADLNLTNILLHPTHQTAKALVIDFDRARVFPGPLPHAWRARSLRRLFRSLSKLDPSRQFYSPADLQTFCHAYHDRVRRAVAEYPRP